MATDILGETTNSRIGAIISLCQTTKSCGCLLEFPNFDRDQYPSSMGRNHFKIFLFSFVFIPSVCLSQSLNERRAYIDSLCMAAVVAHDTNLLAECYYLEGKFYEHNEPIKAVNWFHKSLDLVEPRGPSKELARLYVFLGSMSKRIGLSEEEEMYKDLARRTILLVNDSSFTKRYFTLFEENPSLVDTSLVDNLARIAQELKFAGKFQEAIHEYRKILGHYAVVDSGVMGHVAAYLSLSQIYSRLGNVDEASLAVKNARQVMREDLVHNVEVMKGFEYAEFLLDSTQGKWKDALSHFQLMSQYEKEVFYSDRAAAISQLNIEYQTEKQKQLLDQKESEFQVVAQNSRLRKFFLAISLTLLLISIVALFYLLQSQRRNKLLAEKNKMLLREQNHRVKNNLQFISSMLRLQGAEVDSNIAQQQLENTRLRIESMALLQRRLYSNGNLTIINLKDYSESILETVLESNDLEDVEIDLDIDEVELDIDRTLSIGLILTELAQNSCKYAFYEKNNPRIYLSAKSTMDRNLRINYKDNGSGGNREKSGFGLQMIKYQVAQLKGILTERDNFEIIVEFKI